MENKLLEILNEMREEAGQEKLVKFSVSMHLQNDLGMDSFMLAELTVRLEAEFGIDIFEEGIVQTLGEVLAELEKA